MSGTTIQELSAKLSFDIDNTGFEKFDRALNGAQSKISNVFSVRGAASAGLKLFEFGASLEWLRTKATLFGDSFGFNIKRLEDLSKELHGSTAENQKDAFASFIAFTTRIGQAFPELEQNFEGLYRSTAKIQNITGEGFEQSFSKVMESILTGNIDYLRNLPGFSQLKLDVQQKILEIINSASEGFTSYTMPQRMNLVQKLLDQIPNDFAADMAKTNAGKLKQATAQTEDALLKTGDLLTPAAKKALDKLKAFLEEVNSILDTFNKKGATAGITQANQEANNYISRNPYTTYGAAVGGSAGAVFAPFSMGTSIVGGAALGAGVGYLIEQLVNLIYEYLGKKLGISTLSPEQRSQGEYNAIKKEYGEDSRQAKDFKANNPSVSFNFGDIHFHGVKDGEDALDRMQAMLTDTALTLGLG